MNKSEADWTKEGCSRNRWKGRGGGLHYCLLVLGGTLRCRGPLGEAAPPPPLHPPVSRHLPRSLLMGLCEKLPYTAKTRYRKFRNKYFQVRNCAPTTVPTPTFMFLWGIYIFHWSVCLFCCRKIGGPNVGIYVNSSQTQECGNRERGRAIPSWEYIKSNFFAV